MSRFAGMNLTGIIFDCDGTLADTMPAHYEAWAETLIRYELELSEDRFYALGGWPTEKVTELLVRESGRTHNVSEIATHKEELFLTKIHLVEAIAPVVAVAREHHQKLPLGVATGGTRDVAEKILRQIGVWGLFDAFVCAEDVSHHKPAPDVFLEAARRLGVDPRGCLVYEDTNPGIEAARRAGMRVVDVREFYKPRRVTA